MNTLKNVLFFGLLLAVLCFVYLSLNRSPEHTLPPGLSGDTRPPKIEIPGLTGSSPSPSSSSPESDSIPGFPAQPPPMATPPAGGGGVAPPYQPLTAGPTSAAPPFSPDGGSAALAAPSSPSYPPGVRNPFDSGNTRSSPPSVPSTTSLPESPVNHSSTSLDLVMQQVKLKVGENRFADALLILSQLYGSPDLPASQSREVTLILDQMAAKVIYSREHWLESAYLVQASDTLDTVADRYQVPALLLARINGIHNPQNLPPGKELKVLKGPFSAQISTDRSEMTLMLADRYAGRFSVVLNNDLSHATGIWKVREKGPSTAAAGAGSARQWIELGNASGNISILGTNDTRVATGRNSRSTIWLSEQDMDDVFGILSVGSSVIIQR